GKILVPEGTNDVAVNTPIAMILADGEDAAALKDGKGAAPKPPVPAPQPAKTPASADAGDAALGQVPLKELREAQKSTPEPAAPEPEVPEGTEMVTMTMREALRTGMAEEMRRDPDVVVLGEEVVP